VDSSSNSDQVRPALRAYSLAGFRDANYLFEPDLVLPEQFARGGTSGRSGEFELLWTVFADGIQTYCREILRGSTSDRVYREVEYWIFQSNSDAITSFANLCELFGIDARRMRRALIRFRENPSEGILNLIAAKAA
jgi:hypothetical protein